MFGDDTIFRIQTAQVRTIIQQTTTWYYQLTYLSAINITNLGIPACIILKVKCITASISWSGWVYVTLSAVFKHVTLRLLHVTFRRKTPVRERKCELNYRDEGTASKGCKLANRSATKQDGRATENRGVFRRWGSRSFTASRRRNRRN